MNNKTHGGKRSNAGRKHGKTGISKPYAVSLSETQRNWLKSEYGSLTKAIKTLLPENIL